MTVYYVEERDRASGWYFNLKEIKGHLPVGPYKSRRLAREAQREFKTYWED